MTDPNAIVVSGTGAVSPAGWGVAAMRAALDRAEPLPLADLARPGWPRPLRVRRVPSPAPRPAFFTHARLRRTSPIAQFAVGAALEALGRHADHCSNGRLRLGIVLCAMSGCVNYSRRFYDEVLKEPATASPLVFPETVYNSSASHLAALLGATAINYTIVGDPGAFVQGIALGADWLASGRVDGCVVVGAEEMDWLTANAMRLFERRAITGEGAGALFLQRRSDAGAAVQLHAITSPQLFHGHKTRAQAAAQVKAELRPIGSRPVLSDGLLGLARPDRDEKSTWANWPGARMSLKTILGEGFMAAAAWQCVAAVDAVQQNRYDAATVSVVGCNQQAIAAQFVRSQESVINK